MSEFNSKTLNNKIALITGASRGIGQAIALFLAKSGAYVIGTATTADGCEKISRLFDEQQLSGMGYVLNVTDQQQIDNLFTYLTEINKIPNILVNNAGITRDNLLLRMDDEEWLQVIETNLTSIFRLTKICIKSMFRQRWGRIINIGSVVGSSGNAGQVNYAAAKAGVIGFTKSLAQEIGSRNITVNVVAPGFIDTEMTAALPDMFKDELRKRIPLRGFGAVDDVASIVAYLASDSAQYITGQTINVNGGMYMN